MHHSLSVVIEVVPSGGPNPRVVAAPQVVEVRRIGIAYAGEPWTSLPWRFLVPGSRSLSRQP